GASGTTALTVAQYRARLIKVTGTLTANVTYQIPSGVGGFWTVQNSTSGAFTVTISSGGAGTSVAVAQGYITPVASDGTNIVVNQLTSYAPLNAPSFTGGITVAGGATVSSGNVTISSGTFSVSGASTLSGAISTVNDFTMTKNFPTIYQVTASGYGWRFGNQSTGTTLGFFLLQSTSNNFATTTNALVVYGDGHIQSLDTISNSFGYKGLPQNAKTANYTLVLTDFANEIYLTGTTASQTITIPANASVAFPIGAFAVITNDSTQNWSITITSDTLLWSPSGGTGTRTLAPSGTCTITKKTATRWWITGTGLT
ncbi:MAG: hypothetical protein KGL39_38450, partial [Patescibacteria group bacterium]|nr:hypothetical protein [Patescibacteria group bacterium]